MMELVLVDLGEDVWVNFTELASIEPYRDVWGAREDSGGTVLRLKSGEIVRVRHKTAEQVIAVWQDASLKVNSLNASGTSDASGTPE